MFVVDVFKVWSVSFWHTFFILSFKYTLDVLFKVFYIRACYTSEFSFKMLYQVLLNNNWYIKFVHAVLWCTITLVNFSIGVLAAGGETLRLTFIPWPPLRVYIYRLFGIHISIGVLLYLPVLCTQAY